MIEPLINLIEKIKNYGLENVFNRYYSIYRAQVTVIKDPEKRGRIKVNIPVLFGDKELPNWVLPKGFYGSGLNSNEKGKGAFYPPSVDDWVFVSFEMGSLTAPVYDLSGWVSEKELSDKFTHVDDTPMVRGYIAPEGSRILFDETEEKTKLSIVGSDGTNADDAKEHSLEFSLEKDKEVLTLKSIGHTFTLDDTKDKEVISLLSKIGTKFEITEKGTFKITTKAGHIINMDDEAESVKINTKAGASVLLKESVIISESKSKTTVTIAADGIKIITDKDLTMEAKKCAVTAKEIAMDGGGGKLSLKTNKVALGGSGGEVVEQIIAVIDALISAPSLVGTGTGPSTGILPPAMTDLTAAKVKLNTIKGSL